MHFILALKGKHITKWAPWIPLVIQLFVFWKGVSESGSPPQNYEIMSPSSFCSLRQHLNNLRDNWKHLICNLFWDVHIVFILFSYCFHLSWLIMVPFLGPWMVDGLCCVSAADSLRTVLMARVLPGTFPVTAIIFSVGDGKQFRKGVNVGKIMS